MSWINRSFALLFVTTSLVSGCGPQRKPFDGVAPLPCAPSLVHLMAQSVNDFESKYPKARINLSRHTCRDAIDSLLNKKTEQIVIDRPLTKPESLAFRQKDMTLYTFRLARMPMSLIVNNSNPVNDLDSLQLAAILTGTNLSWSQAVNGTDRLIKLYLPPPGDGVWELLQVLYRTPDRIIAEIVPSDSIAYRVAQEPDALGAMAGVAPDYVKPLGLYFNGKLQRPTLRAIHEQRYPWVLPVVYITFKEEIDVATSFLNHVTSNPGQRLLSDNGVLPAMVPIRVK
ncbi:MAG: substrate-binding domain-containing protein [bacterium]|nr:substrate-binding domain-containing protein [bacterium]